MSCRPPPRPSAASDYVWWLPSLIHKQPESGPLPTCCSSPLRCLTGGPSESSASPWRRSSRWSHPKWSLHGSWWRLPGVMPQCSPHQSRCAALCHPGACRSWTCGSWPVLEVTVPVVWTPIANESTQGKNRLWATALGMSASGTWLVAQVHPNTMQK